MDRVGGRARPPIVEDYLDVAIGEQDEEGKGNCFALRAQLVSSNMDHPFQFAHNCPGGIGLEAMRAVIGRYGPRRLATKRAVLKPVITTPPPSKRAGKIGENPFTVEELIKKYEALAGKPLADFLEDTVLTDLRV